MRPGWLRTCTCEAVELDAFCEDCMAFRSQVRPFFAVSRCACEGKCGGRAFLPSDEFCGLVGERGKLVEALDEIEKDPEHKAKREDAWRGGTLGH